MARENVVSLGPFGVTMTAVAHALLTYVDFELGAIIETGVANGTSLREIVAESPTNFPIFGFDWFEGLPEDWTPAFLKGSFSTDGVVPFVPGAIIYKALVADGLPKWKAQHRMYDLAFLHIDTDLYGPAKEALTILNDRIVPGTVIVFDEYHNYTGWEEHEHRAFIEWQEENKRRVTELPNGDNTEHRIFRKTFKVMK